MDPRDVEEGFRTTGVLPFIGYARILSKRLHDIYAASGLQTFFSLIVYMRHSEALRQNLAAVGALQVQERASFQKPTKSPTDAAKAIRTTIEMILGENSIDGEGKILEGLLDSLSAVEIASKLQDRSKFNCHQRSCLTTPRSLH